MSTTRRFPIREPFHPMTVEVPTELLDHDAVRIEIRITPMRRGIYGENRDLTPNHRGAVGSDSYIAVIEGKDQRALSYFIDQVLRQVLTSWFMKPAGGA